MKRPKSSDSLIPIYPIGDEKGMYGSVFPSMLDDIDENEEELSSSGQKKRRLGVEQVRALEKNFEVENKLDPERKARLAQDLGLEPRQVAVWFQNRRARWKTKQLERGYNALKASYDALKIDVDGLRDDKQSLLAEIKALKAKLDDEEAEESFPSVKREPVALDFGVSENEAVEEEPPALIFYNGQSDSDSSAILNDDPLPIQATTCDHDHDHSKASALKGFSFLHHQLLKAEEQDLDEPCSSFFADEQAPTLPWCYSDHWNWMDNGGEDHSTRRDETY